MSLEGETERQAKTTSCLSELCSNLHLRFPSLGVFLCMKLQTFADPQSISHIHTLLHPSFHQMNADTSGKRRRNIQRPHDPDDGSSTQSEGTQEKNELKGILTLLPLPDDHGKKQDGDDDLDKFSSTEDEKPSLKKNAKSMPECNSYLHDDHDELERTERIRKRKKSRGAAFDVPELKSGAADSGLHYQRRLWVKDRSGAWWQQCSHPDFPEQEFKKAFRMGKATFDMICEELNPAIAKGDTTLRNAIPVRQRVAVCMWRLATGDPLRLVSQKFGLGISTCHKLILEVCTAIRSVLMLKYLQWPDQVTLSNIKAEFESISGIPNVVGSMFTSHVPIAAPKVNVTAYYNKKQTERNQKTSYSVTVQGVVDPRGVFTDVSVGWPGSMSDDEVLQKSALGEKANGGLLNGMWLVGSSGYPLMDWVLVPYTQQNLTWTQHAFNEKIEGIQKVSKHAFARLKGRWGCLQKRTEVKLQDLPLILGACCVLHNICEFKNEEMDPELKVDLVDDKIVPQVALRSENSMKARDLIAHNLLHHGLAGTSFL
ncbi:protein ALP1-like [Prosopis cineraria]|uniref:protein ALP1-like n=1 Tax=Prosopis cineraria TaxID=364024 RepID=UPI00240EC90D|nr:protein ALP1-like [Prosopis cineraria]